MNSIKKCLVIIAILFSSANIYSNVKIDPIIKKMSDSKEVIQFFSNNFKLNLVNSMTNGINEQIPKDILDKKFELEKENEALIKLINSQFPEFVNSNEFEKSEIINGILISPAMETRWSCVKGKIIILGGLLGVDAAVYFGLAVFKGCVFASFIADLAVLLGSGGAATVPLAAAAVPELLTCSTIAGGTVAVTTTIAFEFIANVFGC